MAIVNRDLDASQQVETVVATLTGTVTDATLPLCVVPYPARLIGAKQVVTGLSGAPNHSLWIGRFVPGAGMTSINIGSSLVAAVFTTSGAQSFAVPGNVTYPLQEGDQLFLGTAAANTACARVSVTLVLRALQDIKQSFGQSS